MKIKGLFGILSLLCVFSLLTGAGIDLSDPLQTGQSGQSLSDQVMGQGSSYIEGTLYSESGAALRNGRIFISVGANVYSANSDFQGYFKLSLPFGSLPSMIILQAEADGYIPDNQIYYTNNLGKNKYAFKLRPLTDNYIIIEPRLIHLGDDLYTGAANSQFQIPTSGSKYQTNFNLPFSPNQIERAVLRITVKGAEANNPVLINNQRVGYLRLKNNFGNSGEWAVEVPTNVLKSGSNTLTINSFFENDYDDFEFSNVRLELSTRHIASPPLITIHEPENNAQIINYDSRTAVNLKATIASDANISWIKINGKALGGLFGQYAGINEIIYLTEGSNTITIEAQNVYGQSNQKRINVTVIGYPEPSLGLIELFSISSLNYHKNAQNYLANASDPNTAAIYYPMWGEGSFHNSFLNKYRFLDPDRIDLPSLFINGQTKLTSFTSFPPSFKPTPNRQIRVSCNDTSGFGRASGRLTIEYTPANFNRDLVVFITLAEPVPFQNYLLAKEVFEYRLNRSYSGSMQRVDIPFNFSVSKKAGSSYVISVFDSAKNLLYCTVY